MFVRVPTSATDELTSVMGSSGQKDQLSVAMLCGEANKQCDSQRRANNAEFCATLSPVTRTAGKVTELTQGAGC